MCLYSIKARYPTQYTLIAFHLLGNCPNTCRPKCSSAIGDPPVEMISACMRGVPYAQRVHRVLITFPYSNLSICMIIIMMVVWDGGRWPRLQIENILWERRTLKPKSALSSSSSLLFNSLDLTVDKKNF